MSERWRCPGALGQPHIAFGEAYVGVCRMCALDLVRRDVAASNDAMDVVLVELVRGALAQLDKTIKDQHKEIGHIQRELDDIFAEDRLV